MAQPTGVINLARDTGVSGDSYYYPFTYTGSWPTPATFTASSYKYSTYATYSVPSTATVYCVHDDHLSGSNAITNEAGSLVQTLDYYPYGSLRINAQYGNFNEKRKFTGHEFGFGVMDLGSATIYGSLIVCQG